MRKLLLAISFIAFCISSNAQALLELKIIKTGTDGGVDISYDDGEYENDDMDKLYDDDLDMGWEGDKLNVMTTFLRFQNVTIPQGATIESAIVYMWAHEDENDEAKITIYAEDTDNSPAFTDSEKISDRTWTTANVAWDITEKWTMWEGYNSPELKNLIQAVVDRSGWQSGNSLTLFFQGENQGASALDNARDFESFENIEDPADGGDGLHHPERIPMIKIYYTQASSDVSYTIAKTGTDGGVDISYDDGEYENDDMDKLYDDDLDMGWEGDKLNIMTTFLRFQNVAIPQGAVIESAKLKLYAHEDENDEARITIFAEDIDNSPSFTDSEKIGDRTWTTASTKWTITEKWTMWDSYTSVDFSNVVQAVISRSGWQSGNSLTLFFQGENQGASALDNARDFESFENIEDPADGGDGLHHPERIPQLMITYNIGGSSIQENYSMKPLLVYPNPSESGIFNIEFDLNAQANVYVIDMTGNIVHSATVNSQLHTLDLSDLNSGLYIVKAIQDHISFTQKVIIK